MGVCKRIIFFVLFSLQIFPLYSDNSTDYYDNSCLFDLRDFLFMERAVIGLRDACDWAKKYELQNSQGYKDFVSKYCNDIARQYAFDAIKARMFADLTQKLHISDAKPDSDQQNTASTTRPPSAPVTLPLVSHFPQPACILSSDHEYMIQQTLRMRAREIAEMAQHEVYGQNKLHQMRVAEVDAICRYTYARVRYLEYDNKNIDFVAMQSKLPNDFKQSFEKRRWYEGWFGKQIEKSAYERSFYYNLFAIYGQDFTHEQLIQYQYAQMHRWAEYHNEEFVKFIQTFALYNDYIIELDKHFKTCSRCVKNVHCCETTAYHRVANQAAALHKKYENAKKRAQQLQAYNMQQRNLCMQEIFKEQVSNLDDSALEWQESNPERAQAYKETIENHKNLVHQPYTVSPQASECLLHHGFDSADYNKGLYGNPLQQELFGELLNAIEFFAQLPQVDSPKPFDNMLRTATIETLEVARKANEMGDCFSASKLIDIGYTFLDYSFAVVQGVGVGIGYGFCDAVGGVYNSVRHPIDTATAFGHVALVLAKLAHDFMPRDLGFFPDASGDRERLAETYLKISAVSSQAKEKLWKWWRGTPTRDKLYEITKGPIQLISNVIITGQLFSLMGHICKIAGAEAVAFLKKSKPFIAPGRIAASQSVATTAVQVAEKNAGSAFENISEIERVARNTRAPTLLESTTTEIEQMVQSVGSVSVPERVMNTPAIDLVDTIRVAVEHEAGVDLFNFTGKAMKRMNDPAREMPVYTLYHIIKYPIKVVSDPQGALPNSFMHYAQIIKNGKQYNAEVLYDYTTNTISHFLYAPEAMGPLPRLR